MKAVSTFREVFLGELRDLVWEQWSQMGVSVAPPERREERAGDPEALLVLALHVGRYDPRLFDEILDWLARNLGIVSGQRLRNIGKNGASRPLVAAALDWATHSRRPAAAVETVHGAPLQPLFRSLPAPRVGHDQAFARHGFTRDPATPSGKSRAPRLTDPINFAFRLRKLLGVGVRAEVVRTLLTIRAPRVNGAVVTASAGFAQRNVREGLGQLHEAGVIDVVQVSDDRHYRIDFEAWARLLRMERASELPLHYDWIPACRALIALLTFLEEPGVEAASPYIRASRARTVIDEISTDLQYIGVGPHLFGARGADYWADFESIALAAVRKARDLNA
jgi:hypothetical protein